MDNVYALASNFKKEDFSQVLSDDKQTILHTTGDQNINIYFVRSKDKKLKILGIRFCFKDEYIENVCVRDEEYKNDLDKDGWWDSLQTLFR